MPDSDFDPVVSARRLLREARSGALASLMAGSGDPYCSLVNVATSADGAPLLLLSRLAVHTRNILADGRVSLMLDERKEGDPLQGARAMLAGRVTATDDPEARRRYLVRHPEAEMFAGFADFAIYRIAVSGVHLVAGFGRIVDLPPERLLFDIGDAAALIAAEGEVVAHINADHSETCLLYATRLLGAPDGPWRCTGCNPDGLELQWGNTARWLPFPAPVASPAQLRAILRDLAHRARSG